MCGMSRQRDAASAPADGRICSRSLTGGPEERTLLRHAGVAQLVERQLPKRTSAPVKPDASNTCDSGPATDSSRRSSRDADSTPDDDLQRVIAAWPALPEAIRAGILAMVKAATGGGGDEG